MDKKNGDSKCIKLWYMKKNNDSLFNYLMSIMNQNEGKDKRNRLKNDMTK